ncbi:MAG: outer membrane beta-barrel protein [Salinivirgaceae bacterium]|jgi:hypothetical protein|nr:outer membrane beta-barrel protein [Salinivirgaceae bacterium]
MTIQQDIDKILKEGLKDYSENPPSFVWDNIEQNLNQRRFRRNKNIAYSIAASIALLLAFGAGYMYTNMQTQELVASNKMAIEAIADSTDDDNQPTNKQAKEISTEPSLIENENKIDTSIESILPTESSNDKSIETTPSKSSEPKQNSNIKKVKSSGSLLPPIFASTDESEPEQLNTELVENKVEDSENELNNESELVSLNPMVMKKFNLPNIANKKQLAYDSSQLVNVVDYILDSHEKKDYSTWSVGVSAAPLVSYRDVVNSSQELAYIADINSNYQQNYTNEKPLMSYSAGVNVKYSMSKRWKVQTGIYYAETGQVSENVAIYNQPAYETESSTYSINTSVGNIAVNGNQNQLIGKYSEQEDMVDEILGDQSFVYEENRAVDEPVLKTNFVQTYEFYEIPVVVDYTIVDRKLSVNVSGGLSANILYANNTYVQDDGSRYELDAEAEDLKNMNYSGVFGLGIEYPIVSRLKFNMQPTVRYSLSSINNSGSVYPYSFGVYTGLRYDF